MQMPDLEALKRRDPDAWDLAFRWLWPTALKEAHSKLYLHLPSDVEDVAIEAMQALVDSIGLVETIELVPALARKIARNKAVSYWRRRFSDKGGGRLTESLEALGDIADPPGASMADSPLEALGNKEFVARIRRIVEALKPPLPEVLADRLLEGLSYEEIAKKRGIPKNSVGVYLSRGLKALRHAWGRQSK